MNYKILLMVVPGDSITPLLIHMKKNEEKKKRMMKKRKKEEKGRRRKILLSIQLFLVASLKRIRMDCFFFLNLFVFFTPYKLVYLCIFFFLYNLLFLLLFLYNFITVFFVQNKMQHVFEAVKFEVIFIIVGGFVVGYPQIS